MKRIRLSILMVVTAFLGWTAFGDYNVRRPSEILRPRWTGAAVGEWTLDFEAARTKAVTEGRTRIVMVTGSWWCPYCEALEEKVLNSSEWSDFVTDNGIYLSMLDFPYRGTVRDEEEYKSVHPELGAGWGFNCWLYDDAYLADNGLTQEDGFRAIGELYAVQNELSVDGAQTVSIVSWNGIDQINYGRVGYPTIIIYLPDGREAGRFTPIVTDMEPIAAREYVIDRIENIISSALDEDCGLCNDTDETTYAGEENRVYRGWISNVEGGLSGTVYVKATKRNRAGKMKFSATVYARSKTIKFKTVSADSAENLVFEKNDARMILKLASHGLHGYYSDAENDNAQISGAIDCYRCSDAPASALAEGVTPGRWSFIMKPVNPSTQLDRGFGALTIEVFKNGNAKVRGYLGDGKRVALNSKVIVGETGVYCLPVFLPLYTRQAGGVSFIVWFKDGVMFNVTEIGDWKAVRSGKTLFSTRWKPIFSPTSGSGRIDEDMELIFQTEVDRVNDLELAVSPDFDEVSVEGRKWIGTKLSYLSLKQATDGCSLAGQMRFTVVQSNGRNKRVNAKVFGVICGGAGYVTVIRSGKEAWSAKISSCNACSD